jgi:hypothetical protein
LVILVSLFLASCIGIDADVTVGTDGSVDVSMRYTISMALDELGKLGANADYLPLPVGQADLELAATRAGGELRSWSRKNGSESSTITASLRFPDISAFTLFLDPLGKAAIYTENDGTSSLRIDLYEGTRAEDTELVEFIKTAFSDYMISIRLELPRTPRATGGFLVSGRVASFSMKAADLYTQASPVSITVSW